MIKSSLVATLLVLSITSCGKEIYGDEAKYESNERKEELTLTSENAETDKKLEESEAARVKAEAEKADAEKQIEELTKQLESTETDETERNLMAAKVFGLNKEITGLNKEIAGLKAQLENQKKQEAATIKEMQDKHAEELGLSKDSLDLATKELEALRTAQQETLAQVTVLAAEKEQLLQDLEASSIDCEKATEELAELKILLKETQDRLAQATTDIIILGSEIRTVDLSSNNSIFQVAIELDYLYNNSNPDNIVELAYSIEKVEGNPCLYSLELDEARKVVRIVANGFEENFGDKPMICEIDFVITRLDNLKSDRRSFSVEKSE